MKTAWIQSFTDEKDRLLFAEKLRAAHPVIDKLKELCYKRVEELRTTSPKDYSIPNWPYLRADRDGQIRAYEDLIDLLTLDQR